MSNILRYQAWLNENRIFEDDSLYINWRGKLSGPMPKLGPNEAKNIIGVGIKTGKPGAKVITFGSAANRGIKWSTLTPPKSTPALSTKPQTAPPIITPSVDFKGADFPYPDNIITPNWTVAQSAKTLFDGFIANLVDYFKLDLTKAKANFKSITIEGAADIAPATNAVPAGYTKLDHNYGGATPNNKFLAENRALKMKDEIINALTANGGLTADVVTFISSKITTTFKTDLPRGGRYVKITTDAIAYDIETPGTVTPGTTTPGTETPGQVGASGETPNTYSVLTDNLLQYFFGNASKFKIESSEIRPLRPDANGNSDFVLIKLNALQKWAKEYLGGELLSSSEVGELTATVEDVEIETPAPTRAGEVSASYVDQFTTISFNVPNGKVFAPSSDVAGNDLNTIVCSIDNAKTLNMYGRSMNVSGMSDGFPFVLYYILTDDGEWAQLAMIKIAIGRETILGI